MKETAFLRTAIHGRYADSSEKRLTQIFVASFNSSETIRRAVACSPFDPKRHEAQRHI